MRAQLGCWAWHDEDGLDLAPLEGTITFSLKSLTEAFGRGGCVSPQPNPKIRKSKRPDAEMHGAFFCLRAATQAKSVVELAIWLEI